MLLNVLGWISLASLSLTGALIIYNQTAEQSAVPVAITPKPIVPTPVVDEPVKEPEAPKETPPVTEKSGSKKISLNFYSQAPFGIWDPLHEDACEEANLLMLEYWRKGEKPSLEAYDEKLKNFVGWQTDNGYGISVGVKDTQTIAKDYLNLPLKIIEINSIDDIKAQIDAGNPIVWPADGKMLKNPYFRDGGPPYHMLLVIGYDGDKIITNDPGTKRGAGYQYSAKTLLDALGDWTGSSVDRSSRQVLILEK